MNSRDIFSSYQCRIKEQEFLALKQGDMSILEYERRFHDLSLFASQFIATEQHMIDRLRDGLRQELRQGLIALRFESIRELIEAAQAVEACITEGHQGQTVLGKRKDIDVSSGRPPYFKRGKPQFRRKEGITVGTVQSSSIGTTGGQ